MKLARILAGIAIAGGCSRPIPAPVAADAVAAPTTPREPVVDTYFGTRVVDPYRWMEARTSPRFVAWLHTQDDHARAALGRIPRRAELLARVAAHSAGGEAVRSVRIAGGRQFYLKRRPSDDGFKLFVREPTGAERVLIDPAPAAIDYYEPSHDGARLAYAMSTSGSEDSVLRVLDVATGAISDEAIDRTIDGRPAWRADGRAVFYNRLAAPRPGAPPAETYLHSRVYLHIVGTDPATDQPILGTGVAGSPPLAPSDSAWIRTAPGSPHALAMIGHASDSSLTIYVAPVDRIADGAWRKVASPEHGVLEASLHGAEIYLVSRAGAPRYQVLRTSAETPQIDRAEVIVPASNRVIGSIASSSEAIYVSELDGGMGRVRRFDFATKRLSEVALPVDGTVRGPITDPAAPAALVGIQSWLSPEAWYRIDAPRPERLAVVAPWQVDTSAFVVEHIHVQSWDGTQIPLSIVRRRDLPLDGSHPIWLTAYGAYGIALTPRFIPRLKPLLDDGGVYAVAHVRGGGEYGDPWHRAGKLATKPNTHKDLIACAEQLIARGYGSAATLAIDGASGGGIAVGMAMAARPELFRVVFSQVGDHNPLRIEVTPDGPLLVQEFGTTQTEAGFRALLAIDSTQAVRSGTRYPAVLLGAAFNDARVPPWQPGKLAAHLQAATASGRPVLLRIDFDAGHGMTSKSMLDHWVADQLAFLYWQIGRPAYQPTPQ